MSSIEETVALIKRLILRDTSKRWKPSTRTKRPPLPLEIQLGGNALRFGEDEGWYLDGGDGSRSMAENVKLRAEVAALRKEVAAKDARLVGAAEEANMAKYQNQLLLEMLAVSRVVETRLKGQLRREKTRQEELSRELEAAYGKLLSQLGGGIGGEAAAAAAASVLQAPPERGRQLRRGY